MFTLPKTASSDENVYLHWHFGDGSESRFVTKYSGVLRQVTINSAFTTTPTAGSTTYTLHNPNAHIKTINSPENPGESCMDLLGSGYNHSGYYWLRYTSNPNP